MILQGVDFVDFVLCSSLFLNLETKLADLASLFFLQNWPFYLDGDIIAEFTLGFLTCYFFMLLSSYIKRCKKIPTSLLFFTPSLTKMDLH